MLFRVCRPSWNGSQCSSLQSYVYVQACTEQGRDFAAEFEAAWDCYLPFVRRYGDALSVGFQCVPFFAKSKVSVLLSLPCFYTVFQLKWCQNLNSFKYNIIWHAIQQPFYRPLSGTNRVSRCQKKHSPTHHPDHHPSFIQYNLTWIHII